MNELNESVNNNRLYFDYVGSTQDVSFCEYIDSKELFKELKDNRITFNDALKKKRKSCWKNNQSKNG